MAGWAGWLADVAYTVFYSIACTSVLRISPFICYWQFGNHKQKTPRKQNYETKYDQNMKIRGLRCRST